MTSYLPIRQIVGVLVSASLSLVASSAVAQGAGSRLTREFVQASASSDEFEILEAQTVLGQSKNAQVRVFASQMLQEHQQHGEVLKSAALKSSLKPPEMAMSADQAQLLSALQSVNGKEFDVLYVKHQVLAHRSALVVSQKYADLGIDPVLKEFAFSTVQMISAHIDMAGEVAKSVGTE